jgi:hypothetical protein
MSSTKYSFEFNCSRIAGSVFQLLSILNGEEIQMEVPVGFLTGNERCIQNKLEELIIMVQVTSNYHSQDFRTELFNQGVVLKSLSGNTDISSIFAGIIVELGEFIKLAANNYVSPEDVGCMF